MAHQAGEVFLDVGQAVAVGVARRVDAAGGIGPEVAEPLPVDGQLDGLVRADADLGLAGVVLGGEVLDDADGGLSEAELPAVGDAVAVGVELVGVAAAAVGVAVGGGAVDEEGAFLGVEDAVAVGVGVPRVGGQELVGPGGAADVVHRVGEGGGPGAGGLVGVFDEEVGHAAVELLRGGEAVAVLVGAGVVAVGDEADVVLPAVGDAVVVGVGALRVVGVAEDVVHRHAVPRRVAVSAAHGAVELLDVGVGGGVHCGEAPELRQVDHGGGQAAVPAGARVEAERLVDVEVLERHLLADFHVAGRLGGPGLHVLEGGGGQEREVGLRHGVGAGEIVLVDGAEEAGLVVIEGHAVVGQAQRGLRGQGVGLEGVHAEEVVVGGVEVERGHGVVVAVGVGAAVVGVGGVQAEGVLPAVGDAVAVGVAVDGVGAQGDFLGVAQAVVVEVAGVVPAEGVLQGVEGREHVGGLRGGPELAGAAVGVVIAAAHGELRAGVERGALVQVDGRPEGGVQLGAGDEELVALRVAHRLAVLVELRLLAGEVGAHGDAAGVVPQPVFDAVGHAVVVHVRGVGGEALQPVGVNGADVVGDELTAALEEGLVQEHAGGGARRGEVVLAVDRRDATAVFVHRQLLVGRRRARVRAGRALMRRGVIAREVVRAAPFGEGEGHRVIADVAGIGGVLEGLPVLVVAVLPLLPVGAGGVFGDLVDGVAVGVVERVAVRVGLGDSLHDGVALVVDEGLAVRAGGLARRIHEVAPDPAPRGGVFHADLLVVVAVGVDIDEDVREAVGHAGDLLVRFIRGLDGLPVRVDHVAPALINVTGAEAVVERVVILDGRIHVRDAVGPRPGDVVAPLLVDGQGDDAGVEGEGAGGVAGGEVVGAGQQAHGVVLVVAGRGLAQHHDLPFRVGEPAAMAVAVLVDVGVGGVERLVAAADAESVAEGRAGGGEGAGGDLARGAAEAVDAVLPAEGGERVALGGDGGDAASLDEGAGVLVVAQRGQEVAVGHAVLVVVAQAEGVGVVVDVLVVVGAGAVRAREVRPGVAGQVFGHEDGPEDDVHPRLVVLADALTVEGDGTAVDRAFQPGGAHVGLIGLPGVEEGILGRGDAGHVVGEVAARVCLAGEEGGGREGDGGARGAAREGGVGPLVAPQPARAGELVGELHAARAVAVQGVEVGVDREALGGAQRDGAGLGGLLAGGVAHREGPRLLAARAGDDVREGDGLGAVGGARLDEGVAVGDAVGVEELSLEVLLPRVLAHEGDHLLLVHVKAVNRLARTGAELGEEVVAHGVVDLEAEAHPAAGGGGGGRVEALEGGRAVGDDDLDGVGGVAQAGDDARGVAGGGAEDGQVGHLDFGAHLRHNPALDFIAGGAPGEVVLREIVHQRHIEGGAGLPARDGDDVFRPGGAGDGAAVALEHRVARDVVLHLAPTREDAVLDGRRGVRVVIIAGDLGRAVGGDGIDEEGAVIVRGGGHAEGVFQEAGQGALGGGQGAVIFLAGVAGLAGLDGDVLAAGGGLDTQVIGAVDGAGRALAGGHVLQLRHADAVDRLAGASAGGDGEVDGAVGQAVGIQGHVGFLKRHRGQGDVGIVLVLVALDGEALDDGVERAAILIEVDVLLADGNGEGLVRAGGDGAAVGDGRAVDLEGIVLRGDKVGIGHLIGGARVVGGDEGGLDDGIFPIAVEALGGGGVHAVADADDGAGGIGVALGQVDEEALGSEGAGVADEAARVGGREVVQERRGGVAGLDGGAVVVEQDDARGHLLPGVIILVLDLQPEVAVVGIGGAGEGRDGARGGADRHGHEALVKEAAVEVALVADGQRVTVDGDGAGGGRGAVGPDEAGGIEVGGLGGAGARLVRQLDFGEVAAEERVARGVLGPHEVFGQVARAHRVGEAQDGLCGVGDARGLPHVVGHGGVRLGGGLLGVVPRAFGALLDALAAQGHVQLQVGAVVADARDFPVAGEGPAVEARRGVGEGDVEIDNPARRQRLADRGLPTFGAPGDGFNPIVLRLRPGRRRGEEAQHRAHRDQKVAFAFHTSCLVGRVLVKGSGLSARSAPRGCPWPLTIPARSPARPSPPAA